MNIFFTADLHFGHFNIIKYCARPWKSVDDMDAGLISNWNDRVSSTDLVWILGDVFFCKPDRAIEIMNQLNGKKNLILGNHDAIIKKNKALQECFQEIYYGIHETTIKNTYVVMSHYPLREWTHDRSGAFMLHGHTHNNLQFDLKCRRLDVGVDAQSYFPISWEEICDRLRN